MSLRAEAWRIAALLLATGGLLLVTSCNKKQDAASSSGTPAGKARVERRATREEDGPDPRVVLRESFDQATAESDPAAREKAMEQVAWDGIDVDPELAREAFAALEPGGPAARRLVGHFAMRLADTDPDQALEWARGLEQEEERVEAVGRIAVVISARDPERGAALAAGEMPAGLPRDRAVVQILQHWSRSAPAEAVEWIAAFPQGAARGAGLKAVAAAWMESDPAAVAAWVGARDDGPVRNEALLAIADSLRPAAPEVRATRLASFGDAGVRRKIEDLLSQSP